MSSKEDSFPVIGLSEILDIQGGAQPPASTFKDVLEPGYVRFVQIRDFETDAHLTHIQQLPKWRYCSVEDVLIARYGASVGRICRGVAGAYNVALAKVIPKGGVELGYLYYLLKSDFFQGPIAAMSGRSAQAGFNKDDLAAIRVPVAPLTDQREIAALLSCFDDRITLLRETNATLEAIAQALFKSWFVDFDPVRAKMAGRAPEGMDEATAALFPDALEETTLGLVPKGWSVKTLADVTAYLNRGLSPKYVDDGGLLVLNQKCVRDFSIDWSKGRRHDPNQRKVDGRLLEKGDVLVNSTGVGTLGRVGQILNLPEPAIVDSHVTVVRAGEAVSWPYLGQWMQSRQGQIEAMGEGSTGQTELSRSKLGSMPLLVPTGVVLAAFDAAVLPLKARISCNADTAQSLSMLRDTLLPRLISGQLRLPEAQARAQLEAAA